MAIARPPRPPSQDFLIENARGVAYAAFAPIAAIARRLGCPESDAAALQEAALGHFAGLMIAVRQAKPAPAPKEGR